MYSLRLNSRLHKFSKINTKTNANRSASSSIFTSQFKPQFSFTRVETSKFKNLDFGYQFRHYSGGHNEHHGYPEEVEVPHKLDKPRWHFTRKEVSKHNSKEDCWIIIHGKVYDVTEWILFHPGLDKIATNAGYDSTELFEAVGHQNAVYYMQKYYIGDIVEEEKTRRFTCNSPTDDPEHFA